MIDLLYRERRCDTHSGELHTLLTSAVCAPSISPRKHARVGVFSVLAQCSHPPRGRLALSAVSMQHTRASPRVQGAHLRYLFRSTRDLRAHAIDVVGLELLVEAKGAKPQRAVPRYLHEALLDDRERLKEKESVWYDATWCDCAASNSTSGNSTSKQEKWSPPHHSLNQQTHAHMLV